MNQTEPSASGPGTSAPAGDHPSTPSSAAADRSDLATVLVQPAIQFAAGARFGTYRIVRQIGIGGMGVVYEALDTALDRVVALKLLKPELTTDPAFGERFLREARAAARIQHQHVVTIYAAGEIGGVLFMALELVPGGDLAERIRRKGPLPPADALRVMLECSEGLQAIHEKGIVHRDINPQNIFIDDKGRAKLGDLGLARSSAGHDRLTATGAMMGTPAYMAPEQAEGCPDVDVRADIHALGASLYTMLTGRVPYEGPTLWAVFRKVMEQPPPDPRSVNTSVSAHVSTVVLKAMAKDRADRYQTPGELLRAIRVLHATHHAPPSASDSQVTRIAEPDSSGDRIRAKTAEVAEAQSAGGRPRGRTLLAIAVAALVVGSGLGAYGLWRQQAALADGQLAAQRASEQRTREAADENRRLDDLRLRMEAERTATRADHDRLALTEAVISAIDTLIPGDEPTLTATARRRADGFLSAATANERTRVEAAWKRWESRLRLAATVVQTQSDLVRDTAQFAKVAGQAEKAVGSITQTAEQFAKATGRAEKVVGDFTQTAELLANTPRNGGRTPAAPDPTPREYPPVADTAEPSAQATSPGSRPRPTTPVLSTMAVRPNDAPRAPDPGEILATIRDLRAEADDEQIARVGRRVAEFSTIAGITPLMVREVREAFALRQEAIRLHRAEDHARSERARLRPLLASLDEVTPIPDLSRTWIADFSAVVDPTNADLLRWRGKVDRVDGLKRSCVAIETVGAVLEGESLAQMREALNQIVSLVGTQDGDLRRWRLLVPAWATRLGRDNYGPWTEVALAGVVQRFRWCPPGRFTQGSPRTEKGRDDDETQHDVQLTRGVWLADSECTQALWQEVMRSNPSGFLAPDRPVESVRWTECQDFIARLNRRVVGLDARLPSEAEWEYACRADSQGPYAGEQLADLGWFASSTDDPTHPVRSKAPNRWGIYDMHGNVWEFCQDSYREYAPDLVTDPIARPQKEGDKVVVRGGSRADNASACRSANRSSEQPGGRNRGQGLRIALSPAP